MKTSPSPYSPGPVLKNRRIPGTRARSALERSRRPILSLIRLAPAGGGHLDQVALRILPEALPQIGESGGAAVADRGAQVLHHVADDQARRAACGHADLHAFRAKRLDFAGVGFLDVE